MKTFLSILCLTSLVTASAHAARPAAAPSPAASPAPRKSDFDAASARNPFWPIGWKKPSGNGTTGPALTAASFNLTSVTTGNGPRFAILNGKILQQGQQFSLQFGSDVYQVTVQSIQDGQVILSYPGGDVLVPLHRH